MRSLALPPQVFINQRVPKKHLLDLAAVNSADKKAITEGIEEIVWVAVLKPHTVGVPAYEDAERQYLEIAVLTLELREGAKVARLRELVHRAIPYPLVLLTKNLNNVVISLCELRHAQNEAGKTVLDGELLVADPTPILDTLALNQQSLANLATLYRGWYRLVQPLVRRAQRMAEIDALRREAEKETQLARRVELNLKIQKLSADVADDRR